MGLNLALATPSTATVTVTVHFFGDVDLNVRDSISVLVLGLLGFRTFLSFFGLTIYQISSLFPSLSRLSVSSPDDLGERTSWSLCVLRAVSNDSRHRIPQPQRNPKPSFYEQHI